PFGACACRGGSGRTFRAGERSALPPRPSPTRSRRCSRGGIVGRNPSRPPRPAARHRRSGLAWSLRSVYDTVGEVYDSLGRVGRARRNPLLGKGSASGTERVRLRRTLCLVPRPPSAPPSRLVVS